MKETIKKKIKRLSLCSKTFALLLSSVVVSRSVNNTDIICEASTWSNVDDDLDTSISTDDVYKETFYLDLKSAEELGILDKNPTKEELIQAVNNHSNINNEFKQYFYNYINKYCKKYPKLDKAVFLKNIESLEKISIEDIEASNTLGTFSCGEHKITIDVDIYNNDESNTIYHEIGHLNQGVVIENKDYIIRILFDDNMNYNYRFGRSFLEILNTYFTEDIGFIQDNDYPAYTNLLRYATNISTKQLAKIYSGGHISDLVNLITKNVECDNVSEFINCNDKLVNFIVDEDWDSKGFDKYVKKREEIENDLYKLYIDYFFKIQKLNNYKNYDNNYINFMTELENNVDSISTKQDKKVYDYFYKKEAKVSKKLKNK